jgi:hypothetical protein
MIDFQAVAALSPGRGGEAARLARISLYQNRRNPVPKPFPTAAGQK